MNAVSDTVRHQNYLSLPLEQHFIMRSFQEKIKEKAKAYHSEAVALRRHFHRHPELSFEEKETSAYISAQLTKYGIEHQTKVAGYGIIGIIRGRFPEKKCIALRADMDALPITEITEKSYCSANQGVMHACGHDAHTSILLITARILAEMSDDFEGTIKLLFQPAEEKLPGGALGMIEASALEKPDVSAIAGLHVLPTMEAGKVGFRDGAFMASSDEVTITIKGKGGHAAMPDLINDTVLIAAQTLVNLQQVVSRLAPPLVPTVLSFGRIIAEGAHNVIPSEVVLNGTFRTFDEAWRNKAEKHIHEIATGTATSFGAQAVVEITKGYPVLINDLKTTETAYQAAVEFLGSENVEKIDQRMTAEDFAWYTHRVPACFFRLGTGNTALGITSNLHTPTFDIDENSLETGIGTMVSVALKLLESVEQ